MERIIEQKPGSSAMITLIPYHISKWGYHPVEYWCIYLYKVNEYQICTLTKKNSENMIVNCHKYNKNELTIPCSQATFD